MITKNSILQKSLGIHLWLQKLSAEQFTPTSFELVIVCAYNVKKTVVSKIARVQRNFDVTKEEIVQLLIISLIECIVVLAIEIIHELSFLFGEITIDKLGIIKYVVTGTIDAKVVIPVAYLKLIQSHLFQVSFDLSFIQSHIVNQLISLLHDHTTLLPVSIISHYPRECLM